MFANVRMKYVFKKKELPIYIWVGKVPSRYLSMYLMYLLYFYAVRKVTIQVPSIMG